VSVGERLFLGPEKTTSLERERGATVIQTWWRRYRVQKQTKKKLAAAIKVQAIVRMWLVRRLIRPRIPTVKASSHIESSWLEGEQCICHVELLDATEDQTLYDWGRVSQVLSGSPEQTESNDHEFAAWLKSIVWFKESIHDNTYCCNANDVGHYLCCRVRPILVVEEGRGTDDDPGTPNLRMGPTRLLCAPQTVGMCEPHCDGITFNCLRESPIVTATLLYRGGQEGSSRLKWTLLREVLDDTGSVTSATAATSTPTDAGNPSPSAPSSVAVREVEETLLRGERDSTVTYTLEEALHGHCRLRLDYVPVRQDNVSGPAVSACMSDCLQLTTSWQTELDSLYAIRNARGKKMKELRWSVSFDSEVTAANFNAPLNHLVWIVASKKWELQSAKGKVLSHVATKGKMSFSVASKMEKSDGKEPEYPSMRVARPDRANQPRLKLELSSNLSVAVKFQDMPERNQCRLAFWACRN
jgi:hypothetical protein